MLELLKKLLSKIALLWREPTQELFPLPSANLTIYKGWLQGVGVTKIPSKRRYEQNKDPIAIVWHYTATKPGTAKALANRIRELPGHGDRSSSWHVIISTDGQVYQSVSFLDGSWHCKGNPKTPTAGLIDGRSPNRCSVGIELESLSGEFTAAQITAATDVLRLLVDTYGISRKNASWGHLDLGYHSDPGPTFMKKLLPQMLLLVYGS